MILIVLINAVGAKYLSPDIVAGERYFAPTTT
ncbi:hypothetical protein M2450_000761 [Dysgonomonas sp. PF1-23]|nr:hypothetical protein [Dysgonomonas sp. PF1-23]